MVVMAAAAVVEAAAEDGGGVCSGGGSCDAVRDGGSDSGVSGCVDEARRGEAGRGDRDGMLHGNLRVVPCVFCWRAVRRSLEVELTVVFADHLLGHGIAPCLLLFAHPCRSASALWRCNPLLRRDGDGARREVPNE